MTIATVPLVVIIAAAASVVLLLPPVSITEVRRSGRSALSAKFYAPLLDQLVTRGVAGPIEVVPARRRGEAFAVASVVPIAKGWSRQVDTGRNPIFYDGSLNADTFGKWLDYNAISYVAISNGPDPPGWRRMKRRWCAAGCHNCKLCGRTQSGPSMPSRTRGQVDPAPGRVIARDPVSLNSVLAPAG